MAGLETEEIMSRIAAQARDSYNRIARHYNEPSHETVRNFEVLVRDFLQRNMSTITAPLRAGRGVSIDLGGGRGWVAKMMAEQGYDAVLADISDEMLACARSDYGDQLRYEHASAFDLPFESESAGLFTTNLCGAYLGPTALAEIERVLVPGGIHVITETPTEWVQATHPDRSMPDGKTWYKDGEGENVLLPFTYIYTLPELSELVRDAGREVKVAETLTPADLIQEADLSAVNRHAAERLGLVARDVPVLSAVIAAKPHR